MTIQAISTCSANLIIFSPCVHLWLKQAVAMETQQTHWDFSGSFWAFVYMLSVTVQASLSSSVCHLFGLSERVCCPRSCSTFRVSPLFFSINLKRTWIICWVVCTFWSVLERTGHHHHQNYNWGNIFWWSISPGETQRLGNKQYYKYFYFGCFCVWLKL